MAKTSEEVKANVLTDTGEIVSTFDEKSGILVLTIDTHKVTDRMTKSGKNKLVATTGRGETIPGMAPETTLQLNLFHK